MKELLLYVAALVMRDSSPEGSDNRAVANGVLAILLVKRLGV